jgi:hypothetical protein
MLNVGECEIVNQTVIDNLHNTPKGQPLILRTLDLEICKVIVQYAAIQ